MKRYMFYDRKTGEILHTHQVFKLGSDEPQKVSTEELKMLTNRMVDPDRIRHLTVTVPPQSSHKILRSVNPKTGKLMTKRAPKDYWRKRTSGESSATFPAEGGR